MNLREQLHGKLLSWQRRIERHARRIFNTLKAEEVVLIYSRSILYIIQARENEEHIMFVETLPPPLRNELKAWRLVVGRAVGEVDATVREAAMYIFADGRYVLYISATRSKGERGTLIIRGTLAPLRRPIEGAATTPPHSVDSKNAAFMGSAL